MNFNAETDIFLGNWGDGYGQKTNRRKPGAFITEWIMDGTVPCIYVKTLTGRTVHGLQIREAGSNWEKQGGLRNILQSRTAYAIMPIGKKEITSPSGRKNETPNRVPAQSGASSFLFTAAKHPPGYLLSSWSPSNHLMM